MLRNILTASPNTESTHINGICPHGRQQSDQVDIIINAIAADTLATQGAWWPSQPGPCIAPAIWLGDNPFRQWQRSFKKKSVPHWLKVLQQCCVVVEIESPGHQQTWYWPSRVVKYWLQHNNTSTERWQRIMQTKFIYSDLMIKSQLGHTLHITSPLCRKSAQLIADSQQKGSIILTFKAFFVVIQDGVLNKQT